MRYANTPTTVLHVLKVGAQIFVFVRPALDRTTSIRPLPWFQRN